MTVDFLSCGTCFVTFRLSDINMFIEHKKASCCFLKSPFTSNLENNKYPSLLPSLTSSSSTSSFSSSPPLMTLSCSNVMDNISNNNNDNNNNNTLLESQNSNTIFLKCVQCSRKFTTPWTFLMHVQVEHQLIFIDTIGKFSKTYEQQLKNTLSSNVEELLNETNVDVDDNDDEDDDDDDEDDQCENGVLHTIDKLLSEKVNNSDSDTTITSTITNDDNKYISPNNNNNNTNSTTDTPTITSNTAHTDNSSSISINSNSHNASTQTYLTGIKQHSIPHRKRKYVSCCIGESTVTCNRLNNIKTCSNVKSCNLTLSSCCNNLSTGICPYNLNSNNNNDNSNNCNSNNNDNSSNGSSMNSDIYVSDYCCTTGSIICKPTTCSNLLNTNEIVTQDTSRCTASTAIVSCCMRKLVCCTSTPVTLPICCDRSMQNEINNNNNNNFIIQETKTTNTARITCCPCSPKRSIISQSSEVQTDFDPEFSYSDYADLAMLLNAATPTTITSPLNSILSPQLPLLSDMIIQQSSSPPASPQQQNNDNDEYCQNIELPLKNDIINKPYINVVNSSNSKINDNYLSQIDHISNTNTDINSNNSIILNNSSSSSSSSTITTTNVDIDVTMKSMPVSSGNAIITSNVNNNDNMITSTANVIFQMPTIMHTNLIACPNIDNKSNNNNNVNKYYCDSIPPRRYICRDCGTSFRQNVHLRKHIMIQHTKVKPFSCPYCQYTTVEKSHLTVHIRTHTGERPFSCRECNYSSAQNCTLKSHYLRKHPTNLIKCNYCSELFFTELELTKHLRGCSLSFRQQ